MTHTTGHHWPADDEAARIEEATLLPGAYLPPDAEIWRQAEALRLARSAQTSASIEDQPVPYEIPCVPDLQGRYVRVRDRLAEAVIDDQETTP